MDPVTIFRPLLILLALIAGPLLYSHPSLGASPQSFVSLCLQKKSDPNLRKTIDALLLSAVRSYWWHDDCEQAAKVLQGKQEINLAGRGISDLRPLASFPNIKKLNLKGNRIVDLTPLSHLKRLEWIDLRDNRVRNTKTLKQLPRLKTILLGDRSSPSSFISTFR